MVKEKTAPSEGVQFTKRQLISSAKYAKRRDLLAALLADDGVYTTSEVDALIVKFMKGAV